MSFNKTTEVTQTGLGDEQFSKLQKNQKGLGSQIEEGFSGASDTLSSVSTDVSGLGTKIDSLGNTVNDNTNTGFTNLNTYLKGQFKTANNNFGQLAKNQTTGFSQLDTNNQNRFNSLNTAVGDVASDVDTGFADQTTRFDNLDTAVDTGFSDAETQLSGFAQQADTRFNTLDSANDNTQSAINSGFANTQDDVANMQTEVLGGQGNILSDLAVAKSERDAYQTVNSEAMTDLQETSDDFRSNFDQYVNKYSDNTNLQNETIGNIQTGLTNFAGDVTRGISGLGQQIDTTSDNVTDVVQGGFIDTSNQMGNLGSVLQAQGNATQDAIDSGFTSNTNAMSDLGTALSSGFGQVGGDIENVNLETDKIPGMLRSLSMLESVPTDMRQQYYQLSNSFDTQGNLIRNSVDENGNTITRQLDNQGNLLLRRFTAQGNSLGQMSMNLNDVRSSIANLPSLPGASSGMGRLSPAMQDTGTGQGGFMSPYGMSQ